MLDPKFVITPAIALLPGIAVRSVAEPDRLTVSEIGEGCWRVVGRYGYMESPDAGALLEAARAHGLPLKPAAATYYFNHEMVVTGGTSPMKLRSSTLRTVHSVRNSALSFVPDPRRVPSA